MDILSLKPVICKCCKKEFKGQRSNSLLNYHLGTKPPFIANDWRRQQSPKTSVPTRLHCASGCDKYNGSKRYDNYSQRNRKSCKFLHEILINLMRYRAQQKNHLKRK